MKSDLLKPPIDSTKSNQTEPPSKQIKMSDLLKDGEQMLEGERNNQQGQDQSQMTDQSQQSSGGSSSGGGFMQGMERNTEDAYINVSPSAGAIHTRRFPKTHMPPTLPRTSVKNRRNPELTASVARGQPVPEQGGCPNRDGRGD